jgi:hypothetical protein
MKAAVPVDQACSGVAEASFDESMFLYMGIFILIFVSALLYFVTTPPNYHENEASYKRAINLQRIEYDDIAAYYDYSIIATSEAAKDLARASNVNPTSPPRKNELPQLWGIRQYSSYHRNRRRFLQQKSASFHRQQQLLQENER